MIKYAVLLVCCLVLNSYNAHCRGGHHNSSFIHIKAYCSVNTMNFSLTIQQIVKVCSYKIKEYASGATKWSWEFKRLKERKKEQSDK